MAVNRTQASLNQETAVLVADFLCKQLPVNYHVGWDNESSSAGIAGCELLAALGCVSACKFDPLRRGIGVQF